MSKQAKSPDIIDIDDIDLFAMENDYSNNDSTLIVDISD